MSAMSPHCGRQAHTTRIYTLAYKSYMAECMIKSTLNQFHHNHNAEYVVAIVLDLIEVKRYFLHF